ncbi:alpha-ketoglutarate-dependent dioxygenase AlkB family protein [Nannocystis bainbridge]|uniref:Alpha-ketoglutarate-dependent dioxygenase AlkB n=1 Tax=Nannocystis bainbridge TaxID=2995303 RepID=A0ABT5DRV3_9BACT|nr:alpha-ketoglutarate-dependent dioxygenase AlkB [Nannocystis bainbridge]MDC0716380.1 alpha-ketoglutarate-dependent dioxygenase AlkB [Nannocystis bainbridge]
MTAAGLASLLDDRIRVARGFVAPARAAALMATLLRETPWLAVRYENGGRPRELPRLTVNYGERSYDYSGLVFTPLPWTPLLTELRALAEATAETRFNALIVQLYRDGEDGVNWHADDSPGVGRDPIIASLSFGATRQFLVRARGASEPCLTLALAAGDLLIMRGDLQHTHQHKVPREPGVTGPRINLTFRTLAGPAPQPEVAHASRVVRWPDEEG